MSREERFYRDKALDVINKDLIQKLDDYKSYEPIKTGITRLEFEYLGDTLAQNLIKKSKRLTLLLN